MAHRPVLILTHAAWETPALIEQALGKIPTLSRTVLDEHQPQLPRASELGGLVIMGGPQDANDDRRHPGLRVERRLIAESVAAEVPVLGICLGMQLTALALGATLHLRHGRELGFAEVLFSEQGKLDPLLGPFEVGQNRVVLHWHSDAVELPSGATLLASTAKTPVQAFRIGSAVATQFHPEADAALLEAWLATPSMIDGVDPAEVALIRRDGGVHLPRLRETALRGLGTFASDVERRRQA
jgi:GMP synthase (glutamine-hydrolysing)